MSDESKRKKTAQINFLAGEKLTAYLYDLIDEEGFGNTPTSVAQNLMWRAIGQLIREKYLTRRPGKFQNED